MLVGEGANFRVERRADVAIATFFSAPELTPNQGAREVERCVRVIGTAVEADCIGVIFDVTGAPPVFGPDTRTTLVALFEALRARDKRIAIVVSASATQRLQFGNLVLEIGRGISVVADHHMADAYLRAKKDQSGAIPRMVLTSGYEHIQTIPMEDEAAFGIFGNLVVMISTRSSLASLERIFAVTGEVIERYGSVVSVSLTARGSPLPDAEYRARVKELMPTRKGKTLANVLVVEGSGFRVAAIRGFLGTLERFAPVPFEVFPSLLEGIQAVQDRVTYQGEFEQAMNELVAYRTELGI